MITKDELAERIMETELEKIPEKEEVYEKHIFLDDGKVLIVGYDRKESFCEDDPQEECGVTYFWYWELRDSENWDIIGENKDKNLLSALIQRRISGRMRVTTVVRVVFP
ncbi:MAG: hypothetical protein LUQ70_01190 [Methanobacteriaceae archaeon]|nr:hypothetical protein [Methanobacteriaceae archaeon]